MRCQIGSKIDAFEQALTFLNENLKVDMPRVNQSVLVLSPGQVDEATRPIALAALGSGGDGERGGLVGRLVNAYVDGLKQEHIVFALFMAQASSAIVWLLQRRPSVTAMGTVAWHVARPFSRLFTLLLKGTNCKKSRYYWAG